MTTGMGPGNEALLVADGVTVELGGRRVLHGIDHVFEPGSFTAILGPNGAGKSTLLRTLAGLLPPTRGAVLLGSRDLRAMSRREIARALGYLPQGAEMPFPFPVEDVVLMGRYAHLGRFQLESEEDRRIADRALAAVDGADLRGRPVNELSGGEHQRVLLARTLATGAPILLLDEPVANLDIRHSLEFLDLLKGRTRAGDTVILALHDVNLAYRYADRFLLLREGRLLDHGPAERVLRPILLREAFGVEARRAGDTFVFYKARSPE